MEFKRINLIFFFFFEEEILFDTLRINRECKN